MNRDFPIFYNISRNELTEVQGLIHSVGTGQFEASKRYAPSLTSKCLVSSHTSAVGLVWDANKAIQKLPNTNKAAYKRSIMEVCCCLFQDLGRTSDVCMTGNDGSTRHQQGVPSGSLRYANRR